MRGREISDLIADVVASEGAEVVDLEATGSSRPLLRVYVDVPGGTTLAACAGLSRKIEERLDASGLLGDRYTLEVSSPGLDRPLRTRRDFNRLVGRPIRVGTRAEVTGAREIVGVLEEVGGWEDGPFWIALRPQGSAAALRLGEAEITFARAQMPW